MIRKPALIVILSALALIAAIAVITFFSYTLWLRTMYKEDALRINEAFLSAGEYSLSCGEDSVAVSLKEAEYYNRFLLDRNTSVFSRKEVDEDDGTIVLSFEGYRLSFTKADKDGTAIAIKWHPPGTVSQADKSYIVRTQTTYMQLQAYFRNMYKKRKP
ncbi:MAG: hypothetical protein IJ930_01180 [Lachnospiraceae bacterium]|nr:hypothetical protein [Lachnospiraceae bacterium]